MKDLMDIEDQISIAKNYIACVFMTCERSLP